MSELKVLESLRAIIQHVTAEMRYYAMYRYRVVLMAGDRVALQVLNKKRGMPDILPVSQFPGIPGTVAQLRPGSEVLVSFVDGDPAQPIVTHYAPSSALPSWRPIEMVIDADALSVGPSALSVEIASPLPTQGVARMGDAAGPFVITTGSLKVRCG